MTDLKRAFLVTAWIVAGSIVGLAVLGLLLPVLGETLFLLILLLPPIAALFPADRYRKRSEYLPISERVVVSVASVAILVLVSAVAVAAAQNETSGSWALYFLAAVLEVLGVFTVLSFMTFKSE